MKFFEEITAQVNKKNHPVCGDHYICDRTLGDTVFVLADGIGSGIYANVAATFCANRLIELIRSSLSPRESVARTAESMHRARNEDMIFAAFSLVKLLSDGQFTVYSYEAPRPIIISGGKARPLTQRYFTSSYETIAEAEGILNTGDTLVLFSDGISQAGMGTGCSIGIGTEGFAGYLNRNLNNTQDLRLLAKKAIEMTAAVSGGYYADDTTLTMLHCREAKQLTIFSGPPANKERDVDFARRFNETEGQIVICGSSTADIISRETKREIKMISREFGLGSPPEYRMAGADMVTEGAMLLNQLYNILDEDQKKFIEKTPAERLAILIAMADVITFVTGGAVNGAHDEMIFKQVGIKPRQTIIELIAENLRRQKKVVVIDKFS